MPRISIIQALDPSPAPHTDEELHNWFKVHHVLYAEDLLPKWQRASFHRIDPVKVDTPPDVTPDYRASVIAVYRRWSAKGTERKAVKPFPGTVHNITCPSTETSARSATTTWPVTVAPSAPAQYAGPTAA